MTHRTAIDGIRAALRESQFFLDGPEREPRSFKVADVIPAAVAKQQVALDRMCDLLEQIERKVDEIAFRQ